MSTSTPQKLRLIKVWQYPEGLVWSAQEVTKRQKGYLIFHLQQAQVLWSSTKPAGTTATGVMVNQLRKRAASGAVQALVEVGNDTVMEWRAAVHWYLHLYKHDRELRLVDEQGTVWARISPRGSYTKKMVADPDPKVLLQSPDAIAWTLPETAFQPQQQGEEQPPPQQTPAVEGPGISSFQRDIRRALKRRRKTLQKTAHKIRRDLPSPAELQQAERDALTLQNYAYLVQPGDNQLKVAADLTGATDIAIPLNPDLSIGDNIARKFHHLKRAKRKSLEESKQLQKVEKSLQAMEPWLADLEDKPFREAELVNLSRQFQLKTGSQSPAASKTPKGTQPTGRVPYRTFQMASGARILVAKSAKDGDTLLRQAKSNDYWWHVTEPKGAHVIVPKSSVKGELPPVIRRQAGILALHHSAKSQDFAGEIYQSEKRHLRKKKGLPDGLWLVEKSDIIYLNYSPEELAEITAREVL